MNEKWNHYFYFAINLYNVQFMNTFSYKNIMNTIKYYLNAVLHLKGIICLYIYIINHNCIHCRLITTSRWNNDITPLSRYIQIWKIVFNYLLIIVYLLLYSFVFTHFYVGIPVNPSRIFMRIYCRFNFKCCFLRWLSRALLFRVLQLSYPSFCQSACLEEVGCSSAGPTSF